jgi:hypothetical protein
MVDKDINVKDVVNCLSGKTTENRMIDKNHGLKNG